MQLAFGEAWVGRERRSLGCPACRSERLRYSRREYEGFWARLFRLRPAKCLDCGVYFPVSVDSAILNPQVDPAELHVPFWPLEMEERAESAAATGWAPTDARTPKGGSRRGCPLCGSESVRSSRPGGEPLWSRFDIRASYRCASCNGSFRQIVPARFVAGLLIGALALTGLIFLGGLVSRGGASSHQTPRVRQGQIPAPPPPVFR